MAEAKRGRLFFCGGSRKNWLIWPLGSRLMSSWQAARIRRSGRVAHQHLEP
jgi:hypothetical protein